MKSFQIQARRPFVAHFFAILRLLLRRPSSAPNLLFLIFLCAIEEVLIYHIGLLSAQFYYILLARNLHKLYLQLTATLGLILFMALIKSSKNYVASVLYIEWREYLSKLLIARYFEDLNYYTLNLGERGWAMDSEDGVESRCLDNIDQRISQDCDKLCAELSNVISQIVLTPFTLMYYSLQVYFTLGLFGLLACFGMFTASTLVNRAFIKSIVKWTYLKGKHEGNYRTEHANIVKYSELIAFANAQAAQKLTTLARLKSLLSVHENLILSQFYLNVCTAIFDYSGAVLSFVIIAVPIFGGSFDHLNEAELSHKISSNAFICLYLISCFSRIIDISSNFAQINGFGYRITELLRAFSSEPKAHKSLLFRAATHSLEQETGLPVLYLRLSNVHFVPPFGPSQTHSSTIKGLSFEVRQGQNLYITGDAGLGKTSILRVIKGLWPITCGAIYSALDLHDLKQVMFVSHNSRLAHFHLREILSDIKSRQDFVALLSDYALDFILDGKMMAPNDETLESLSPGQAQMLNFLFVFYFSPKLCFLDEATNSLPDHITARLYEHCARLSITVVTIANNDNLHRFHTHFMRIN